MCGELDVRRARMAVTRSSKSRSNLFVRSVVFLVHATISSRMKSRLARRTVNGYIERRPLMKTSVMRAVEKKSCPAPTVLCSRYRTRF